MRPMPYLTRGTVVLGTLVASLLLSTPWVRLNVSPSSPRGLYRLAAVTLPLVHGTLVVLPVPVSVQPWHSPWMPLLKPVAAVAGDEVCVEDGALWIQGQAYGPVYDEAHDMALPHLTGCHTVAEGEVFLASDAPKSLDSRYFSSVPVSRLTNQAFPLLTWR
jgi:type IV secretory pathway protease TraF